VQSAFAAAFEDTANQWIDKDATRTAGTAPPTRRSFDEEKLQVRNILAPVKQDAGPWFTSAVNFGLLAGWNALDLQQTARILERKYVFLVHRALETVSLGRGKKNATRLNAHRVFLDECGFLLIPNVRRTLAPRGHTPIIRHRYRRDKVSAISAVTVSARRRRCGLYIHFHPGSNITHVKVAVFLRALLRQLRGHVIVLWDGGSPHTGPDVRALLTRCPRLHVERFPGYAPDLNPDEFVWTHFKATLANGRPDNLDELLAALGRITRNARQRPALLRSFITASELPAFL
jgi:transposase